MSPTEPMPDTFPNAFAKYFAATRPPFLSATFVACLLGLASAHHTGVTPHGLLAFITVLLALLVHAAINVLNDYYDALNGTDDANTERVFPFTGGSRFIQNGVLTRAQTAYLGYALLAVAMLGGVWLISRVGYGLFVIGAVGVFIGWAYSAAPFKLNSRGWGELCVLGGFLGVVVGADFVQRGAFSLAPFFIGLPYALLTTNLLYINQFPDRKADTVSGKRHWVVRLPLTVAVYVYPLVAALAVAVVALLITRNMLPGIAWLTVLPVLLSLRAAVILHRHAAQPAALLAAIRLTIVAMLLHGILLTLILWISP